LGEVRPDIGTYGRYDFGRLPPLPFEFSGDFAWLAHRKEFDHNINNRPNLPRLVAEFARSLASLEIATARLGVRLPDSFTTFMKSFELQRRIRSTTDCYLNLCGEPEPFPSTDGWLVRFMADSQGCLYWYLYLTKDWSDHAVVSSSHFYRTRKAMRVEEQNLPDLVFVAESFEAFMCRFWLENEICYAKSEGTPMFDVCLEYVERYRDVPSTQKVGYDDNTVHTPSAPPKNTSAVGTWITAGGTAVTVFDDATVRTVRPDGSTGTMTWTQSGNRVTFNSSGVIGEWTLDGDELRNAESAIVMTRK
jgi:hypothetical protein